MTPASGDDIFDDFLSDLGMGESALLETGPPRTSEEVVYEIVGGHRFESTTYLISNQLNIYQHLLGSNLKIVKSVLEDGKVINKSVSSEEYARLLLRYYFTVFQDTYNKNKFMYKGREYPPCDVDKLIDIFMDRHEKLHQVFAYRNMSIKYEK